MAITSRSDIVRRFANGLGHFNLAGTPANGSTTAATASMGHFGMNLMVNGVGSTLPGTLVGFQMPPSTTDFYTTWYCTTGSSSSIRYLCYFYLVGTLNLAATGDQFTHNAATFPVTRNTLRGAADPLGLIPVIYVTTATATTAPIIILKTNAGGAGYVDQDGNNVVGTKSHTFPAAATAAQSCYALRLEDGDCSVRDITAIEVTTAASAGAASVYLVELLACSHTTSVSHANQDTLFGGLSANCMLPASPTAGSLTSLLGLLNCNATNDNSAVHFSGVVNS